MRRLSENLWETRVQNKRDGVRSNRVIAKLIMSKGKTVKETQLEASDRKKLTTFKSTITIKYGNKKVCGKVLL